MEHRLSFYHILSQMNIYVNDQLLIKNLPSEQISPEFSFPIGIHKITYHDKSFLAPLTNEQSYTIFIDENCYLIPKDNPPNKNEVCLRCLNLASKFPNIDVKVIEGEILFKNVHFSSATDTLIISPMTIQFEILHSETKEKIMILPKLFFAANNSYTIIIKNDKFFSFS